MLPFRFGVFAAVAPTMSAWRDQARMAEDLGYSTLYGSDHLDAQFGPLVAITVAAEATSTLHVNSVVLNNDSATLWSWPRRSPRLAWRPKGGSRWALERVGSGAITSKPGSSSMNRRSAWTGWPRASL